MFSPKEVQTKGVYSRPTLSSISNDNRNPCVGIFLHKFLSAQVLNSGNFLQSSTEVAVSGSPCYVPNLLMKVDSVCETLAMAQLFNDNVMSKEYSVDFLRHCVIILKSTYETRNSLSINLLGWVYNKQGECPYDQPIGKQKCIHQCCRQYLDGFFLSIICIVFYYFIYFWI